MTLIQMFHHLAQLPSQFCQIPIGPSRISQTLEHQNTSQPNPGPRPPMSPCLYIGVYPFISCLVVYKVNFCLYKVLCIYNLMTVTMSEPAFMMVALFGSVSNSVSTKTGIITSLVQTNFLVHNSRHESLYVLCSRLKIYFYFSRICLSSPRK